MSISAQGARAAVITSLVAGGLAAGTQPAHASYHLMMIREVFAGSPAQPSAHFVELQMYAPDQNFVARKQVRIFDAGGAEVGTVAFPASVPNGANQASILVGTADVQAAFGVTPDLTMPTPVIAAAGGKACFFDPADPYDPSSGLGNIDCVSWGSFAPGGDTGTPASQIPQGMSIERKISSGNAALLDSPDDTNNSATDFQTAAPSPQKNTVSPGTDATAPESRIGKPRGGKTYNDSTFRRFRGTATDSGSGLALVEIALRQTLENGCKWWNGSRFVKGGCNKKRFKAATGLASWSYTLSKRLKPSDEGTVRFYTLYARATDAAGNIESAFKKGRNANRFEVT